MRDRKRVKRRIIKIALIIAGLAVIAVLGIPKLAGKGDPKDFSMDLVYTDELVPMLTYEGGMDEQTLTEAIAGYSEQLTYGNLKNLLAQLQVTDYIEYKKKGSYREVTREVWNEVYAQILDLLDMAEQVSVQQLLFVDVADSGDRYTLQTQAGVYQYEGHGYELAQYDCYSCYCIGDQIVGLQEPYVQEMTIPDVLVRSNESGSVSYIYEHADYTMEAELAETVSNTVCDLLVTEGTLSGIHKKTDTISGNLISVDDDQIEIEGYGIVERSMNLPVYQVYDDVEQKSIKDIVIGNMKVSYVVADTCVCAILLEEPAVLENIRVLLLNDSGEVYRGDVSMTCDADCTVAVGDKEQTIVKGTAMTASGLLTDSVASLRITPVEGGRITFLDDTGSPTGYGYEGSMEIRRYNEGYAVVNVLSIEHYLYGVVCSEMSARFDLEALKAQAVCARSYAYIQLLKGDYARFGAHIDNSTNYQVYNKLEQSPLTTQAVDETRGQVLSYQDQIIEAYYFSTSYGHTGNYEAWGLDASQYGYLDGTWVGCEDPGLDLSDEAVFDEYIQNADAVGCEKGIKYFRWKAILNFTEVEEQLRSCMKARKDVKDENIIYYESDGKTPADSMDEFGELQTIQVGTRNSSGVLDTLTFTFEQGVVVVRSEYNMRATLGCGIENITYCDDTSSTDATLLPSAYFTIVPTEDGNYTVYGGGYGHGLGMSQNGANLLAEQGMDYKTILETFYHNITITDIYEGGES